MARAYAKSGTLSIRKGEESRMCLCDGSGVAVSDADGQEGKAALLSGFGDDGVKVG